MKILKKTSRKIIFINIICLIIELVGFCLLYYGVRTLDKSNKRFVENSISRSQQMNDMSKLILLQHNAISSYVLAPNVELERIYEREEIETRNMLLSMLFKFERNIEDDDARSIFTSIKADCEYNFEAVDVIIELKKKEGMRAASQYVMTNLSGHNVEFNKSLNRLDEYYTEKLAEANEKHDQYIQFLKYLLWVVLFVIYVTTIISVYVVVKISNGLENHKEKLEAQIERKNYELLRRNRKMIMIQNNTIMGMANLIENRDGETGEHVKRTSLYVGLLANEAKKRGYMADILSEHYINLLQRAAPMHDVGKIVVSDVILKKPGRLTPEEFDQIKLHASEGGRVIREVLGKVEDSEYVKMASEVATCHHEKWDGQGYPFQLKGEQIPLGARIMAIADVFDALVSPRCYKAPMTTDQAFRIILESAGSHFDPMLAKIFVEMRPEVEKILAET